MRSINYKKLKDLNPFRFYGFTNTIGQRVDLLEDPLRGEDAPIIVSFPDKKKAFYTDFYDTEDLMQGSDYEPVLVDGELKLVYEL